MHCGLMFFIPYLVNRLLPIQLGRKASMVFHLCQLKKSLQRSTFYWKCLIDDVEDDDEIHLKALDDVHELLLLMKMDFDVFHTKYGQRITEIKTKLAERAAASAPTSSPTVDMSLTQAFSSKPELHQYVDEVVKIFMAMKRAANNIPSFDLQSQRKGKSDCGLKESQINKSQQGLGVVDDGCRTSNLDDIDVDSIILDVLEDLGKGVADEKMDDQLCVNVGGERFVGNVGAFQYFPTSSVDNHHFLLHFHKLLSCTVVVPENLGCTYDCGAPEPNQLVVSELLISNKPLYVAVFSKRKDLIDYCFVVDPTFNKQEQLLSYGDFYLLSRDDLMSLKPETQIFSNIIECWSFLLIELSFQGNAAVKTSRCFFGVSHNEPLRKLLKCKADEMDGYMNEIFGAWDIWLSASKHEINLNSYMVFIHLHTGHLDHFSCLCINFLNRQLEYLDNRIYGPEWKKSTFDIFSKKCVCTCCF